jgi:transglutaminase-like putative cysteine protease
VFVLALSGIAAPDSGMSTSCYKSTQDTEEKVSEVWMGVYMKGIKVGYSHAQETNFFKQGESFKKNISESWMKVSRLGGNPMEIKSLQEDTYDGQGLPVQTIFRTKISENEIVIQAEISPEKIVFRSMGNIVKELPYEGKFYFGIPYDELAVDEGLIPGKKLHYDIVDLFTYSFSSCVSEVIGKEELLILGKKMSLWHIRTELESVIPVIMDDWVDENGEIWKSDSQASFMATTSIRMSKEKALEISDQNFDIAFSTVIKSNVIFSDPQLIQGIKFKVSGASVDIINGIPQTRGVQEIKESEKDTVILQTTSLIFKEKDALSLPIEDKKYQDYLKPTAFCQSDDEEIKRIAQEIVGEEMNSWHAAKKIAEWLEKEMTPNYDVGFASASETMRRKEGDCSEYTVLAVALFRAVGIPSRAVVGVMYAQGIFAYHMWPEVYVGRWVGLDTKWLAVDPESGEYYVDATHIKLGYSNLDANIFKEMAQAISEIIGKLKLEILDYFQAEK